MSTQIRGNKQIKNITIENDQLVNGTVELNKLREGSELFKRDGSVVATGDLNLNGNKLVNVGAPVDANDAVRKADLDAVDAKIGGTLINREVVSGAKDGENVTFTLANEPTISTEQIFLNGSLLNAGANADYSISGNVITFTIPPQSGDVILANYVVDAIQLNVDVQASLNQFGSRLTTAEGELFDVEQAVIALEDDATALAARVTTAESDISALEVRATNIEANIDAVEADLASEEARAAAAETALDSRITDVEFDITSIGNRATSVESDIAALESADADMDSRVSTLEDGLQAETTARSSAVSSLNTRVTALESADTDVDGRLDVLESDVASLESSVSSEAATRLANDNTLQSNINSEIAARTAADSSLQSNINQEVSDRMAAVDAEESRALAAEAALAADIAAEETRAMAAESALDARIDALESDPVTQAYVDQKVSDLVNSAPAVLDTLKELSDALGGDENFAVTISAQIAAVDDRVDTVVGDLAQEAIDRAADVDAEETRAMAAEAALDSRVDALEAATVAINDLSDVTVTSPSSGQVLKYNGSAWVNDVDSTFSGDYNDLSNKPSLFSGSYTDLSNKPSLFSGSYNDLSDKPNFATVSTSGSYNDLADKPTLFSGSYSDLTNKPNIALAAVQWTVNHTLVDGTRYLVGDLVYDNGNIYKAKFDNESIPTSSTLYWENVGVGQRLNIDGRDIPNIQYSQLSNKPSLFSGSYNDLSDKPSLFSGSYDDLSDKPNFATVATSGSYNDLSDKPSIPSISGLATETYVDTKVADLVASAPAVLDTLNELAAALGDDANFATTVSGQIGDVAADVSALDTRVTAAEGDIVSLQSDVAAKADSASLAAVATSGSYNDLTNKPSLAAVATSGSYNDLSNLPSLFSGAYADLTGLPVLFSGSYNDLTNKPEGSLITSSYQEFSGSKVFDYVMTPEVSGRSNGTLTLSSLYPGASGSKIQLTNAELSSQINFYTKSTAYGEDLAMSVLSGGRVNMNFGASVFCADATQKGMIVKAATSQTANMIEVQNSSGSAIFSVDKDGSLAAGTVPVARVSGLAEVATSGSYNDLSDKPSIPSLTGYATESYVTTAIAGKADSSALASVATSGSYNDLSNLPSLFSGSYADLSNKPTIYTPVKEVPTGTINGTNVTFTLSDAPAVAGTEQVFLNGLLQFAGAGDDYTISGDTITFNTAPEAGWKLVVCYFV